MDEVVRCERCASVAQLYKIHNQWICSACAEALYDKQLGKRFLDANPELPKRLARKCYYLAETPLYEDVARYIVRPQIEAQLAGDTSNETGDEVDWAWMLRDYIRDNTIEWIEFLEDKEDEG